MDLNIKTVHTIQYTLSMHHKRNKKCNLSARISVTRTFKILSSCEKAHHGALSV